MSEAEGPQQATFQCPSCGEYSVVNGTILLGPDERHEEPCDNCNSIIEMFYTKVGNGEVEWTRREI